MKKTGVVKKESSKSIRTIILKNTITIVTVAILLVGGVSLLVNYAGIISLLEKNMKETAKVAADRVSITLEGYLNMVSELAQDRSFDTDYVNADDIVAKNRLATFVTRNGFVSATYCDANGVCSDGSDVSKQQYFIDSKQSLEPEIADLVISKETGELSTVFTAPIVKNNEFKGMLIVVGDATILSNIVKQIKIGRTGSSYVIDNNGNTIAHNNINMVLNQHNAIELAKKNSSYKKIASIQMKMIRGKAGFEKYRLNGKSKIEAYAPINNTNGWSIGVSASFSEFMSGIYQALFFIIILIVLILAFANVAIRKMADIITEPITICTKRIKLLSQGDLTTAVPVITSQMEGAILADETGKTISKLRDTISDIQFSLKEMSEGNFNLEINREYSGDFAPIKSAITEIITELNVTLRQIQTSSELVAEGSKQVFEGAQALAIGATKQAASVGEVIETISDISKQIDDNSENAKKAAEMVGDSNAVVEQGNNQMLEMVKSMHMINESSGKISNIIKNIEDIAVKTNLLSLNASIEAARAGEAGRGFTVIAENVGTLAKQSAQATKATTDLIGNTIELAQTGNQIADQTGLALSKIVDATNNITCFVKSIVDASVTQAEAMNQASIGVENISAIIQENAASAEESSATSEELTNQAMNLNNLIRKFRLKDTVNDL